MIYSWFTYITCWFSSSLGSFVTGIQPVPLGIFRWPIFGPRPFRWGIEKIRKPCDLHISGWWLPYPSEKWWSSSVGMMAFPISGKIKFVFQTTNQIYLEYWNTLHGIGGFAFWINYINRGYLQVFILAKFYDLYFCFFLNRYGILGGSSRLITRGTGHCGTDPSRVANPSLHLSVCMHVMYACIYSYTIISPFISPSYMYVYIYL